MNSILYIYALIDPITNEIRYIGKSHNPKQRLNHHVFNSKHKKTHKECWIYGLLQKNIRPKLIIIEECNEYNWVEREKFHISQYDNLTNLTEGGEGQVGYKHSERTKQHMSENRKGEKNAFYNKHHTSEAKKIISEKNKQNTGEKNAFYNKHHTSEAKKIISETAINTWKNGNGVKFTILYGKHNHAAKKRILISPVGKKYTVYSLQSFCDEMNISYRILLQNINKGKIKFPTDKKVIARQRIKSKNTIGWKILQP